MLRIRLKRTGKRNQPHFRVVLSEHSAPVKGRYLDILGYYNPRTKEIDLKKEKIKEYLKKGARPSVSVNNLLVKEKILPKSELIKITIKPKKKSAEGGSLPTVQAGASGGKGEKKDKKKDKEQVENKRDKPKPKQKPKK